MNRKTICLIISAALYIWSPASASAPSLDVLDSWKEYERKIDERIEKAKPWKETLGKAFPGESEEVVKLFFLTTYKHYLPDSGKLAKAGEGKAAKGFYRVWVKAKAGCAKAGLDPVILATSVYELTNSDWAPVSVARGPGLDRVSTPKEYEKWVVALNTLGKKARRARLDTAEVWRAQSRSYQVSDPKDFAKSGLMPPRVRH